MARQSFSAAFLLRPVVRFCLRHQVSFQQFVDTSREIFLDEASKELRRAGEEPNASRLSAMTGITRRQAKLDEVKKGPTDESNATLIARVIGQWSADPSFLKDGKPRLLSFEGVGSELHSLVARVSKDLNPYTVLKELERTGSVERTKSGLRLVKPVFIPAAKAEEGFRLLGEDIDELVETVEENVLERKTIPNLHLRTEYSRVSAKHAGKVRAWLIDEGSKFHANARKFLSALDLDIRGQRTGDAGGAEPTVRVVLGSFGRLDQRVLGTKDEGDRIREKVRKL
ncbi:MAG: DUF6502 family protein [Bdellovibrionota bacterium]